MIHPFGKLFWQFNFIKIKFHKNKIEHTLIIQYSNYTPRYINNELTTYIHTKTYTRMFIAMLFRIVKNQKQDVPQKLNG